MSNWKQGYIPPQTKEPYQQQRAVPQPQRYTAPRIPRETAVGKKRSVFLLISFVLGALFLIILVPGVFNQTDKVVSQTANTLEDVGFQLGTVIGAALMIPQMIATGIAVTLNVVGWVFGGRGFSLAGAILYCVAALLMIVNAPFLLPSIVLSFIGYAKLKKQHLKGAGGYE